MARKRRLVLDRNHLVAMMGDPMFFDRCPAFAWLRDTAMQTKVLYDEQPDRKCCGNGWGIMRPVIDAFVADLVELKNTDPTKVRLVIEYLETKKGVKYDKILVFYRSDTSKLHRFAL